MSALSHLTVFLFSHALFLLLVIHRASAVFDSFDQVGPMTLYYGCRYRAQDFLYENEFSLWPTMAFSLSVMRARVIKSRRSTSSIESLQMRRKFSIRSSTRSIAQFPTCSFCVICLLWRAGRCLSLCWVTLFSLLVPSFFAVDNTS